MAPEQLEGKEADARADVFAFGAVVFEMVTGKKAFQGESTASVIAAILSSEPAPISTLQPISPPLLDRVVKRCLAKDPDDRWQSARDLMLELKWVAEGAPDRSGGADWTSTTPREHIAWGLASLLLLGSISAFFLVPKYFHSEKTDKEVIRFQTSFQTKQPRAAIHIQPHKYRLMAVVWPSLRVRMGRCNSGFAHLTQSQRGLYQTLTGRIFLFGRRTAVILGSSRQENSRK